MTLNFDTQDASRRLGQDDRVDAWETELYLDRFQTVPERPPWDSSSRGWVGAPRRSDNPEEEINVAA